MPVDRGAETGHRPHRPRNREAIASLPPRDEEDCADASRGLVAAFDPATVKGERGNVVWDLESYDFLGSDCPATDVDTCRKIVAR